jgi:hypothetical protein
MRGSKQDETQFTTKNGSFLSFTPFPPPLNANVLFCKFSKNLTWFGLNSGFWCWVFLTLWISLMSSISSIFGGHLLEWILLFTNAGISETEMIATASISFFKTLALFSIFFLSQRK